MLLCCCRRRRRSAVWFSASIPFWFSILCTMATSVSFHAMQHSKLQTLEPAKRLQDNEDRSKPSRFRFIKYSKTLANRMESLFATLLFELFNTYWIRCSLFLSCFLAMMQKLVKMKEKKSRANLGDFLCNMDFGWEW